MEKAGRISFLLRFSNLWKRVVVVDVICALVILLFVYAAVTKLLDYQKFRVQIGQSPLLTAFAGWVAWLVPAVELIISALLVTLRFRLLALYASFGLMVMFTAYIIAITQFSDYIPCSCGGVLEKLNWTEHLVFNLAFVVLTLLAIVLHVTKDLPPTEPKPEQYSIAMEQGKAENL
jgi:uncharacterized membrane protein YphA (DoxX/SURF4 family)